MHPVNKEGAGVAAPFIDWMHLPPPLLNPPLCSCKKQIQACSACLAHATFNCGLWSGAPL